MHGELTLETSRGAFLLRPERPTDTDFLYTLFRSHMQSGVAAMPVDDIMKRSLLQMQFHAQTTAYRTRYANARFDVLESDGAPFGRLIVNETAGIATIVDFALLPGNRGVGTGTAIMTRLLDLISQRCRVVRVSVLWNNQPSLHMTRRVGFIQTGEDPPHVKMEWHRR